MHYDPELANAFDALPTQKREYFRSMLNHGITLNAIDELLQEGLLEEALQGSSPVSPFTARFIESARLDLSVFQGGEVQERLKSVLQDIRTPRDDRRFDELAGGLGMLLSEGPFRIVGKCGRVPADDVVLAIAVAGFNPLQKVWRYFDEHKANDLIESAALYLCRLDRLTGDPLEGRLPLSVKRSRIRAFKEIFGDEAEAVVEKSEKIMRGTTYVSCWTRRDNESYLAWRHYCSLNGGFAIQSTSRRVAHLHAVLRAEDDRVFCREVGYLDPALDELPDSSHGEEIFWKAKWFTDESEIRFATMRHISGAHDEILKAIEKLPTGERVPCSLPLLIDRIVLNPFAPPDQNEKLRKLIQEKRPELADRVVDSMITPAIR